jgi:hypothetical protein
LRFSEILAFPNKKGGIDIMKNPLQYQRTEYDCGPTSLLNAIGYLVPRDDVPPDVLRYVMMYTLDSYNNKGEAHKNGTSRIAMLFLSNWLNQYSEATKFPLVSEYLDGEQVKLTPNSRIIGVLDQGGVVVVRLHLDEEHYVLLTGHSDGMVDMFDPYFRKRKFKEEDIEIIEDRPFAANRRVSFERLNSENRKQNYALGKPDKREAILLFNENTRRTPEKTIEYFL